MFARAIFLGRSTNDKWSQMPRLEGIRARGQAEDRGNLEEAALKDPEVFMTARCEMGLTGNDDRVSTDLVMCLL